MKINNKKALTVGIAVIIAVAIAVVAIAIFVAISAPANADDIVLLPGVDVKVPDADGNITSEKGNMSFKPVVISDKETYIDFTSGFKDPECLDFMFGFEKGVFGNNITITAVDLYEPFEAYPYNETHSLICPAPKVLNTSNDGVAWCYDEFVDDGKNLTVENESSWSRNFTVVDKQKGVIYWNETVIIPAGDWLRLSNGVELAREEAYLDREWFQATGVVTGPVDMKKIRLTTEIVPGTVGTAQSGEYFTIVKKCNVPIEEAIDAGDYVFVDPWWNVTFYNHHSVKLSYTLFNGTHWFEPVFVNVSTVGCAFANKTDLTVVADNTTIVPYQWWQPNMSSVNDTIVFRANTSFSSSANYSIYCNSTTATMDRSSILFTVIDTFTRNRNENGTLMQPERPGNETWIDTDSAGANVTITDNYANCNKTLAASTCLPSVLFVEQPCDGCWFGARFRTNATIADYTGFRINTRAATQTAKFVNTHANKSIFSETGADSYPWTTTRNGQWQGLVGRYSSVNSTFDAYEDGVKKKGNIPFANAGNPGQFQLITTGEDTANLSWDDVYVSNGVPFYLYPVQPTVTLGVLESGVGVACEENITANVTFNNNLSCTDLVVGEAAIYVGAPNVTVDCVGYSIIGDNDTTSSGIRVYGEGYGGVKIVNCSIDNFAFDIDIQVGNATIVNNNLSCGGYTNCHGVKFAGTTASVRGNNISYNNITGNNQSNSYGIAAPLFSELGNNYISFFRYGVYFSSLNRNSSFGNSTIVNADTAAIYVLGNNTRIENVNISSTAGYTTDIGILSDNTLTQFPGIFISNVSVSANTTGINLSSVRGARVVNSSFSGVKSALYLSRSDLFDKPSKWNRFEGCSFTASDPAIIMQPVNMTDNWFIWENGTANVSIVSNMNGTVNITAHSDVVLNNGTIFVNESSFNRPATLTFYNTNSYDVYAPFAYPFVNGSFCADCTIISSASTYVFNVSHFSNYSLGEGAPSAVWLAQVPSDVTTINLFSTSYINITYNISNLAPFNSSVKLWYLTNTTTGNDTFATNGSASQEFKHARALRNSSRTGEFWFFVQDNEVYPATYNFNESYMESSPHNTTNLSNSNSWLKTRIINFSASFNYTFAEAMFNTTGGSGTTSAQWWYCNNSYTSGNVASSLNCVQFATTVYNAPFNHSHTGYSEHHVAPVPTNGTHVNGVKATSLSYFLIRGSNSQSRSVYWLPNITEVNTTRVSTNGGTTWTSIAGTTDLHVHFFNGNESFKYLAEACSEAAPAACANSTERVDLIQFAGMSPSGVGFTHPTEAYYGKDKTPMTNLSINHTEAISPNSYPIMIYNLSLVTASTEAYAFNITGNNSNPATNEYYTNFSLNYSNVTSGRYKVSVLACDNLSQCSKSYSENLTIDTVKPTQTLNYPDSARTLPQGLILFKFNTTDAVDDATFNCSLYLNGSQYSNKPLVEYNTETEFSVSNLTIGVWKWWVNCTDQSLNENKSLVYTLPITASGGGESPGGGGGGGGGYAVEPIGPNVSLTVSVGEPSVLSPDSIAEKILSSDNAISRALDSLYPTASLEEKKTKLLIISASVVGLAVIITALLVWLSNKRKVYSYVK